MHTYIIYIVHTCMHTYIHACIHACIHAYMHTYIHTYMHTYIHAYMHTYIHTCTHRATIPRGPAARICPPPTTTRHPWNPQRPRTRLCSTSWTAWAHVITCQRAWRECARACGRMRTQGQAHAHAHMHIRALTPTPLALLHETLHSRGLHTCPRPRGVRL